MKQKLIFLDIDGTLLPPGEMTVPASAVGPVISAWICKSFVALVSKVNVTVAGEIDVTV